MIKHCSIFKRIVVASQFVPAVICVIFLPEQAAVTQKLAGRADMKMAVEKGKIKVRMKLSFAPLYERSAQPADYEEAPDQVRMRLTSFSVSLENQHERFKDSYI